MLFLTPALLATCLFLRGASAIPTTDATTAESVEVRSQSQVVKQQFTITEEITSPNGNARPVVHVNGQFPGPALFFDEDDDVEITVTNRMTYNTTIHWHGISMSGTPWSDGVPGLGQTPIEPGCSYVYRFKAQPAGTYWYHSHSRMSLLDGLYGGIFIRPKAGTPQPWGLISSDKKDIAAIAKAANSPTIFVTSDWTNFTSDQYLQAEIDAGLSIFCTDSILINGKGALYCPGVEEIRRLVPEGFESILLPGYFNDKGCLPFVQITEDDYWKTGHPERIPFGLQEGCVAANNSKNATSIINVDPADKWISLNVVMASTLRASVLSIDYHEVWVYEVDGSYIEPVKVQSIVVYPGQRQAIMIKLDQTPSDYTIRVAGATAGGLQSAYGVFSYKGGKPMKNYTLGYVLPSTQTEGWIDYGSGNMTENYTQFDGSFSPSIAYPPNPPALPKPGDPAHYINMLRFNSAWQWTMNNASLMPVDAAAYAPLIYDKGAAGDIRPDLVIKNNNGTWVDLIFQSGAPPGPVEVNHAIHKHGSKFWIIGTAEGVWNYSSVAEAMTAQPDAFNFVDPDYRDTMITHFSISWVAIRYFASNPGPWLLHCHVETHLAGGMALVLLDGVDKWPTIPPEYALGQNGFPVKGHNYNW